MKLGVVKCFLGQMLQKNNANRNEFRRPLEYQRDDALGSRHIVVIAAAKGLQHHSFFFGDSAEEQNPETDKSGKTRHPVWQQQRLGGSPQPEGGIHRVANPSVNSIGDQLMAFPHIEAHRPVSSQGPVREPKHHQRRRGDEDAEPALPWVKRIFREMRDAGRDVSERNDPEAGQGNQQQRRFARTAGAAYNRCTTGTPRIFVPDQIPADGQHRECDFRDRRGHRARVRDARSEPAPCEGESLSEPSSPIIERAPSEARVWYLAETGPHTSMKYSYDARLSFPLTNWLCNR